MHELSIAISIVEAATEEAARHGAPYVEAVHLRLGRLSGVVARALESSFEMASAGTPLAGSRLVIEEAPILIYCAVCEATSAPVADRFVCASCGTPSADVVQGREIEVFALELPA
jgi:hydrogenase nickel incorporation protein HypA/HybF